MSDSETPAVEAARALREVEQRRDQAARTSAQESRWVSVLFGLAVFAQLASPDFFGEDANVWVSWSVTALGLAYVLMLRSRRGNALLGRPTRLRKEEISPRFALWARLAILAVVVIGFVGGRYLDFEAFPYASTVVGALVGAAVIIFGRSWQRALNTLAVRGPDRALNGAAHGSR
jgi:hypothetical protein